MPKPHPIVFALRTTFDEFEVPMPPPQAEYALGRLAALELAAVLGRKDAQSALAREAPALLARCFSSPTDPHPDPAGGVTS